MVFWAATASRRKARGDGGPHRCFAAPGLRAEVLQALGYDRLRAPRIKGLHGLHGLKRKTWGGVEA